MSDILVPEKPSLWVPDGPVLLKPTQARLVATPEEIDLAWDKKRHDREIAAEREFFERYGVHRIQGGAAGAWTLTNNTRTYMQDGTFAFGTDTFKLALFLSTSNIGAASTTYAALTNEVANASGYTTGGVSTTLSLSGTTTVTLAFTQAQWTASGGSITARFGVLYEVGGKVVAYFLCDSTPADVTATNGNTFTVSAGNVWSLA